MGLGTSENLGPVVRAVRTTLNSKGGYFSAKQGGRIPDDDSAVAEIRNLNSAKNSEIDQNLSKNITSNFYKWLHEFAAYFSESLSRYKNLSKKVADGRFSPDVLRKEIEKIQKSIESFSKNYKGEKTSVAFWTKEENMSSGGAAMATQALAWLKDNEQRASKTHENIEHARVQALLKDK
jgi:hypothetical protein